MVCVWVDLCVCVCVCVALQLPIILVNLLIFMSPSATLNE